MAGTRRRSEADSTSFPGAGSNGSPTVRSVAPRPSGLPTYPPAKQPEGATRRGALNAEATEFMRHGDGSVILLCQHPPRRPAILSFSVPHLLRFLRVQRRRHVAQGRGATREHESGPASRRFTKGLRPRLDASRTGASRPKETDSALGRFQTNAEPLARGKGRFAGGCSASCATFPCARFSRCSNAKVLTQRTPRLLPSGRQRSSRQTQNTLKVRRSRQGCAKRNSLSSPVARP